jgi:hypothetical protein
MQCLRELWTPQVNGPTHGMARAVAKALSTTLQKDRDRGSQKNGFPWCRPTTAMTLLLSDHRRTDTLGS